MVGSPAIKELFNDLLELPPEARDAYLDQRCGSDPAARQRIAALLRAHESAGQMLASPTLGDDTGCSGLGNVQFAGATIGPYRLLERIGEGGFGTVYMAEQREPVQRRVALKVIKPGMDSKQVIARFEAERQALAMMDHPNIARVLDAGTTQEAICGTGFQPVIAAGLPYFVMELVRGIPITKFCDENHLTIRERLELFQDVCHAVQHAHTKGVIHRDLKPSNMLVMHSDSRPSSPPGRGGTAGVVKVIDFGIAKACPPFGGAIHGRLTDKTLFTEFHQLIGTPAYMSPEQAGLSDLDIDTRSDIYSMGVLLYELLTGTTPLDAERLRRADFDELRRIIREEEPPRPSTRVSTLQPERAAPASASPTNSAPADRGSSGAASFPASLHRFVAPALLRGDLDWIVMKCLEKERTRRYETANGLAADVQRYLANEPVVAAPPSKLYRLRKTLRRHRGAALSAALVFAVLMGGTIISTALWQRASRAAHAEARQRANAERVAEFMQHMLAGVGPAVALGRDTTLLRQLLDGSAARIRNGELAAAPEAELRLRLTIGRVYQELGAFASAHEMLSPTIDLARSTHGSDHAMLACALAEVGRLLAEEGDTHEALRMHQAALDMRQRTAPGGDAWVLESLVQSAGCLDDLERRDEALALLDQALALAQRLNPDGSSAEAAIRNNTARCLEAMGRAAEALPHFEAALTMTRRLDGGRGDHPHVAQALHNFAFCLHSLMRPDDALPNYQAALEMNRRLHAGDHPDTANCLVNTARCLTDLRRNSDALPLLEEAVPMLARMRAGDHPETCAALGQLAICLDALGRPREALPHAEAALEMWLRLREGDQPNIATCLNMVGHMLLRAGRSTAALDRYRMALEMWQRLRTGDDGHVGASLTNVGSALAYMGRHAEALPYFQAALAMSRRLHAAPHDHLARDLNNMGFCLNGCGRHDEALPYYEEALAIWRALNPGDDPTVATALVNIAKALQSLGRFDEAVPKYEAALAIDERLHPEQDNPVVANDLSNLAHCLTRAGRDFERAESLARQALEMNLRLWGDEHPDTMRARRRLADALCARGQFEQADRLARAALTTARAHPEWGRNEVIDTLRVLAGAMEGAQRWDAAADIYREIIAGTRAELDGCHPSLAGWLAQLGRVLLLVDSAEAATEAEAVLRESLQIRELAFPAGHRQRWLVFNTMSLLGDARRRQGELADAEPLLVAGYSGLQNDPAVPSPTAIMGDRRREALERIVKLYEAWHAADPAAGRGTLAAEWRAKLAGWSTAAETASDAASERAPPTPLP